MIGFSPAVYAASLVELASSHKNDIADTLRSVDLDIFLELIEDETREVHMKLFKPLFELPESIITEIPTIEVVFVNGDFTCERINK